MHPGDRNPALDHVYNDAADVERAATALRPVVAR